MNHIAKLLFLTSFVGLNQSAFANTPKKKELSQTVTKTEEKLKALEAIENSEEKECMTKERSRDLVEASREKEWYAKEKPFPQTDKKREYEWEEKPYTRTNYAR